MSAYFISDPHLGHKNIHKFRSFVESCEDNTRQFVEQWKQKHIKGKDVVYFLGDVAFDVESLGIIKAMSGRKILIKGNHDDYNSTKDQAEVFEEIHGMLRYKEFWLTHCPIHPYEMRARRCNLHGHVHNKTIMKKTWYGRKYPHPKYLNLCVDNTRPIFNSWLVSIDEVRAHLEQRCTQ